MISTGKILASLAVLVVALLIGFQPSSAAAQRGEPQPPPPPASWDYACVNQYTGLLRYVTGADQCRFYEALLDVNEDQPFTLCASRYSGVLRLAGEDGACQAHENAIVVDGSAEILTCANPYTGVMRLVSDPTQCRANEAPVGGGGPISGTIVVNSASLNGWTPTVSSTDGAVTFEVGPDTPPLGAGSVCFTTGTDGSGAAQMRNEDWDGTRLDALTALSYSTYITSWNGQQAPYIILHIDNDGDGSSDDLIFFEPGFQTPASGNPALPDQGLPTLNTWQNWDTLAGGWWSVNSVAGATPGTGVKSLQDYLAAQPDATIVNTDAADGGLRLLVGFGSTADTFDGCVDQLIVTSTNQGPVTYDFEPDIV